MVDRDMRTLFELAREGEAGAFAELVGPLRHRVRALIHLRTNARLRARLDVDDLVQEAMLRAFEAFPQCSWTGERSFAAWITSIAKSVVASAHRRHLGTQSRQVDQEVSFDEALGVHPPAHEALDSDHVAPLTRMRREERFHRLEFALSQLTPEQRDVVIAARIEGRPISEIAAETGRAPNAVTMLLLRALKKLREVFGDTDSLGLPARRLDASPSTTSAGKAP